MSLSPIKEIKTPEITYKNDKTFTYMCDDFAKATNYSKDLSLKVLAGNESKLLKGEYPGPAPIGYVNIYPGKGIEPDPIRAPFITKAFLLYSLGEHSIPTLRDELTEAGFRSCVGNTIAVSVLHGILTNPVYYGAIRRKSRLYEGIHEPLTSKTVFDEVQQIMANKVKRKKKKHDFIYREFLSCNKCNCKITAGFAKKIHIYYRCTNGKGLCDQHKKYWNEKHIEKQFKQLFSEFTLDPVRANKAFEMYKNKILEGKSFKENSSEAIENQIILLNKRIDKLEDMYLENRIDSDKFDKRKTEYQNELTQLKLIKKQQNKQKDEITLELVEQIKNKAIQLDFIFEDGDDLVKKDLLKSLLWNANLEDGKIVSTRVNKLWEPLRNLNDSQDLSVWRRVQDLNL